MQPSAWGKLTVNLLEPFCDLADMEGLCEELALDFVHRKKLEFETTGMDNYATANRKLRPSPSAKAHNGLESAAYSKSGQIKPASGRFVAACRFTLVRD
jgi:hypothetical protein